jgi:hypothetical protein
MALVTICAHCFTECSGKYCSDCNTAEKRRAMDEANEKHFKEHNLEYHCRVCEKEKADRLAKRENDKKFYSKT